MAYDINLTNGNLLATINDGEINTSSSSLSLIGRNVAVYGERVNENLVRLLENFANTSAPSAPLAGQLWYDSSAKQLKLYDSTSWQGISTYVKSATEPTGLENGDMWFNTTTGQVYAKQTSGPGGFRLIGPIAANGFGDTRLIAETFTSNDSSGNHEVLSLYMDGTRLAVFSDDTQYTTGVYAGYSTVKPGININTTVTDAVFNGTATNAAALNNLNSSQFMRSDVDSTNSANVTVAGQLVIGNGSQTHLLNSNVVVQSLGNIGNGAGADSFSIIRNTITDSGVSLRARYSGADKDYVVVDAEEDRVIINSDLTVVGSFNAATATSLANPVQIGLSGNISGSASFDGTANITITTTLDTERLKLSGGTMTGLLNADKGLIASSSGAANLIHATGSKVGILNSNPVVALDVVGAIRAVPVVNGATSGSIILNALTTNHQINLTGTAIIEFANFNLPGQILRIVITGTEYPIGWGDIIYWPNNVSPNFSNGDYGIAVVTLVRANTISPSGPRLDPDFILATYVSY
jgi:hypothetical protein